MRAVFLALFCAVLAGLGDGGIIPPSSSRAVSPFYNGEVVFLGDSITAGWNNEGRSIWDKNFAPLGAVNRGVSGDVTQQTIDRIIGGTIDNLNSRVIVLKIGTNDLGRGLEVDYVVDQIGKILSLVKAYLPNGRIILLGVLPRNGVDIHEKIRRVNSMIRFYDDGNTVRFLDMESHFSRQIGAVIPELFTDGLHLTTAGYQVWYDVMAPLFNEIFYG